MKTIAVFFGGKSPEHDISVITGVLTLNSLRKADYEVLPVFIDKKGEWFTGETLFDLDNYKNLDYKALKRVTLLASDNALYYLKKGKLKRIVSISSAINCCHGGDGENGNLGGLIELSNIALCSPSALSSALFMDKVKTKLALKGIGVKTLNAIVKNSSAITQKELEGYEYPLIVKPNFLGSSVGIRKVNNYDELLSALSYALKYSNEVLVEPCLTDFIEINCAVYRNETGDVVVSECERPISSEDILSFSDKYKNGKREFPASIPKKISDKIKETAEKVYNAYIERGVIRIDFFLVGERVLVNEVNTVPGSLAHYLFSDTLEGFSKMLKEIIAQAERAFVKKSSIEYEYKSGILTSFGAKSAKRLR